MAPTAAPVTAEPTMAPTAAPVTPAPISAPVTPSPTYAAPTAAPVEAPVTTPAPIPTSTYEYWYADVYNCSDCGAITETIVVANDTNNPAIIPNRYYQAASGPDGFSYRCTSEAPEGSAFLISSVYGSWTTCSAACTA
jgi:hypothetical protein